MNPEIIITTKINPENYILETYESLQTKTLSKLNENHSNNTYSW